MMRIGVISDTHGNVSAIRKVIRAAGEVDGWIHLGDNFTDAGFLGSDVPVYAVGGNCDYDGENELVIGLGGARVLITHGHFYGVRQSPQKLLYRAEELGCKAALFGHTHVPVLDEEGEILLLNPGSPSIPRGGSKRSFALLYIDEKGNVDADLMQIE